MGWFSRDTPTHFPPVEGVRLDGTEVSIPADLPADATVLVVSFRDDLDALADQWARLVERLSAGHDGRLAVWELPVMGRAMRHLGEVGTLSLRGQVDDEAERARTIPIYVDKKDFRKTLGLRGSNEVTAFLVDRGGAIAWTGEGDIDMDEVTALEAALADVLSRGPLPPPGDALAAEDEAVPDDEAAGEA